MIELILYLLSRLGEASTYSSIAVLLALYHVNVTDAQMHQLTLYGTLASAVIGVVLREKGTKSSSQVLNDVALTLLTALKKNETPGVAPAPEVLPEHESASPAVAAPPAPEHPTQIGVSR